MEKINWDEFKYPLSCLLSESAKTALVKSASSGHCDPFVQCWHGHSGECPDDRQRKCKKEAERIESRQAR